jgi:predicted unusual protein kinase regulating ubiquinone biosynthesis (AarF/ABC1/UbiB family)
MGYEKLEKVMEEARELPPDQQGKLLEMLYTMLAQHYRMSLNTAVEVVNALTLEDQAKLWKMMHQVLAKYFQPSEEEFEQNMVKLGLLTEAKPAFGMLTVIEDRVPVEVEGKPLSEIIIEERR